MANENVMQSDERFTTSAIVPTIGRPKSLERLLLSLAAQTSLPDEIVIADGSGQDETRRLVGEARWSELGLRIVYLSISPPNAVRQRVAAIQSATGQFLLLLDDDVELHPSCVFELSVVLSSSERVVAAMANFSNERWPRPNIIWKGVIRIFYRLRLDQVQGRVLGPLLRFGFFAPTDKACPMEWLGAGMSLVRRSAYDSVGGFSDFFLRRSTINEDVDLGLKLSRVGEIWFCPKARLAHHHAPSGRLSPIEAAEDDVFNRYMIMCVTQGRSQAMAWSLTMSYVLIETLSNLLGGAIRGRFGGPIALARGRWKGLIRICIFWMNRP
jgi:GT2 family glycosyltransferase